MQNRRYNIFQSFIDFILEDGLMIVLCVLLFGGVAYAGYRHFSSSNKLSAPISTPIDTLSNSITAPATRYPSPSASASPTKLHSIDTPTLSQSASPTKLHSIDTPTLSQDKTLIPSYVPLPTLPPELGSDYYTNSDGISVQRPEYSATIPVGATAQCSDKTYSFSLHDSGTCSLHGGVALWLNGNTTTPSIQQICSEDTAKEAQLKLQYDISVSNENNNHTSILRQDQDLLGQAQVDAAKRGVENATGSFAYEVTQAQNALDYENNRHTLSLQNLKNQYQASITPPPQKCTYQ
jgi:hypothetical protein